MGGYGLSAGNFLQVIYSAVKVPVLLLATFGLTLPAFFVLNTLLGLREDFGQVICSLLATQTAVAVTLASLAPLTLVWYLSVPNYPAATLFNATMFATASISAQVPLRRRYASLIRRNPSHRVMLRMWIAVYAFVGIQMAWTLRPFIGDPTQATTFFRDQVWDNAYVVVFRTLWDPWGP